MQYRSFIVLFCLFGLVISDGLASEDNMARSNNKSIKSFERPFISSFNHNHRYSVPNTSYIIIDYAEKKSTFYTFDGALILEIPETLDSREQLLMLDPLAPNPQPISFEIKRHKPGGSMIMPGASLLAFFAYDIFFYDKNGNTLARFPGYQGRVPARKTDLKKYEALIFDWKKSLDLSGIVEDKTWLWLNPFTWFKRFKIRGK